MIHKERKSGVLMPLFSLPSRFGIGDMGPGSRCFCDFLSKSGQSIWQILPLSMTQQATGNSPYSSVSAFAGNPLYISPQMLFENGLLHKASLLDIPDFGNDRVHYDLVEKFKTKILIEAFQRSQEMDHTKGYSNFCRGNSYWLDDFVLFKALKGYFREKPWYEWPEDVRDRNPESLSRARVALERELDYLKFVQYLFFKQWTDLHEYCRHKKIDILGDMPIYVDLDSADVWANRKYFQLDRSGHPQAVAGVPPDYFSESGQLWGNPLYLWNKLEEDGFSWWYNRIGHAGRICDLLRIDHFRGFLSYWSIPSGEKNAVKGHWERGPSNAFFEGLAEQFTEFAIIAENLGVITPDVEQAMKKLGLPGMLVLQFAFDGDMDNNPYLPHNHTPNNIVYTGTHDNNTTKGWFEEELSQKQKQILNLYNGFLADGDNVSWELIRMAMGSVAKTCIIPMQDLLTLGSWARTNRPAFSGGNWEWRLDPSYPEGSLAERFYEITAIFGRLNIESS